MDIYEQTVRQLVPEQRFGLLTVIRTQGSTARKCGAALSCSKQGEILAGTIGGGRVEQECLRRGGEAIALAKAETASFDPDGSLQDGSPQALLQNCGGGQEVFVNGRAFHFRGVIERAVVLRQARKGGVLLTVIRHDSLEPGEIFCYAEDEFTDSQPPVTPEILADSLAGQATRLHEDDRGNLFLLEAVVPPKRLLVIGGGHCGKAVAELGAWSGYQVSIIDSRPYAEEVRPRVREITWICGDYEEAIHAFGIDAFTLVVIMTQGHDTDALALKACLRYECAYLGMIGSRKKIGAMHNLFVGKGQTTEEQWARICAPIGLDIGAETVKEIALSVLAQIISLERAKTSPSSSFFRCS